MFVILIAGVGKKNLEFCTHSFGYSGESELIDLMETGKQSTEVNRNLYPHIEPYSTGFLKVSDIHTIYWEQSGNPNGHVSYSFLCVPFRYLICWVLFILDYMSLALLLDVF